MRGRQVDAAIRFYTQSLSLDPELSRNHLSLAAAYLENEDPTSACAHLGKYVEANPSQAIIRIRYAELLLRERRLDDARVQFERFIADAQDQIGSAAENLVCCHRRLMEIAEETSDEYGEHLQRGIGLYLLAEKRTILTDTDDLLPTEALLCKAAAELSLARLEKPQEARPAWYLYEVWSHLGQRQPAVCRLREANLAAPFSNLTAAEQRAVHLAYQQYQAELSRN